MKVLKDKMDIWDVEEANLEENRISENLRKALANFAKDENREKFDEASAKLKYTPSEQYQRTNQLIHNSQIRGHWEWDLKRFIDSCDRKTQYKLACGNYIDIKTLKINMKKSEHVHYLKEDWQYIATLLTVESLKEKGCIDLEECLEIATRTRREKSPYNLKKKDSDRLLNRETTHAEKPKPQRRKKGEMSETKTVKTLEGTKEREITLKVKGKNMKTITVKNVRRQKITYSVMERKHLWTDLNETKMMEIWPEMGYTKFTKEPSDMLKEKINLMLKISKSEAESQILRKRNKENTTQKRVTQQERMEELRKKRQEMSRSCCWKQCMACLVIAGIETVILESSTKAHHTSVHLPMNKTSEMDKRTFPVVEILHKE